jgi:hypothetical protein
MGYSQRRRRMKVVSFTTGYAAGDRIIDHLKLTFVAEKPPLPKPIDDKLQLQKYWRLLLSLRSLIALRSEHSKLKSGSPGCSYGGRKEPL